MNNVKDFDDYVLRGNIDKALFRLALPIMGTSFLEMAYNLTDMFWVGTLGSREVSAVGTAGFVIWLMQGLIAIPRTGSEVLVSNSIGSEKDDDLKLYIRSNIQIGLIIPLIYGILIFFFHRGFINFFNIEDSKVVFMANEYTMIYIFCYIFSFLNPILTAIYTASGDSFRPFIYNMIGLLSNMILDPILIINFGLSVRGAAIATVIANIIVSLCFFISSRNHPRLFKNIKLFSKINLPAFYRIIKIGVPVGLQSIFFTFVSMILTRLISSYGQVAIAAQKVTAQVEAISWRTAQGFASAVTAFIGQNYGAKNRERISKVYDKAMLYMLVLGLFSSFLLICFPRPILSVFFHEEDVLLVGISCMKIMGYSQIFMCFELVTAGAFNGLGRTNIPSYIGIIFTFIRWPLSLFLIYFFDMGIDGVWWAITISSIIKGVLSPLLFIKVYYYPIKYKKILP